MINSKSFFLQITLSILLVSFSLSSAQNNPPVTNPPQPYTTAAAVFPSKPIHPSQLSIQTAAVPSKPIHPSQLSIQTAAVPSNNINPSQPSIQAAPVPSNNINPSQPSIPAAAPSQLSTPLAAAAPQVQPSNQAAAAAAPSNNNNPSFSASNTYNGSFSSSASSSYNGSFNKVFAFGDSFTDTGNAYLLGGLKSSFVGSLLSYSFKSLNASQLSGNRQSNGRLVVDFLCDSLSIPYLPPYKQTKVNFSHGANFAIAGATSLSADFFNKLKNSNNAESANLMWKGIPSSFQTQLDWFNKFLQEKECNGKTADACKTDMENSLFWIGGMGRNDYARTLSSGSTFQIPRLKEMTVAYISKFLQTLAGKGAKYIVVQGLPPVGCSPLELFLSNSSDRDQMGCSSAINGIIMAHNELLQNMLADFQKKNSQCTVVYADYWNAFKTILANYKEFNFDEPFKACCGAGGGALNFNVKSTCGTYGTSSCKDPSRYISWDGIHFTEAMHRKVADLFLNQGFCKPSFDQLIKIKGDLSVKGGGSVNVKV
ncbi:hypothetical protein Q3G72_007865 [Acer saccharum]|nr:hypothetical protein Q3G72_007865 [Acer saccharum]